MGRSVIIDELGTNPGRGRRPFRSVFLARHINWDIEFATRKSNISFRLSAFLTAACPVAVGSAEVVKGFLSYGGNETRTEEGVETV